MRIPELTVARRRMAAICLRATLIAGVAAALAGCNTTVAGDTTGGIPVDYRARHPISVKEGKKTLVLFVGHGRGGLSATQRAEVLAFAQNWKRDATGGVTIDRPVGGATERAANDSLKEALSIIEQAGVPKSGIGIRPFDAAGEKHTWLRLNYPLMVANAGPCGLWPDDVGPSYDHKHFENREYYNFGCGQQHNIAAMVANPADLVQPRASDGLHRWAERRDQRSRQMIRTALQTVTPEPVPAEPAPRDEHIAPAPRVSIQAFCETVETAAAIQSAGEDRRLDKAHVKIQMGGHRCCD